MDDSGADDSAAGLAAGPAAASAKTAGGGGRRGRQAGAAARCLDRLRSVDPAHPAGEDQDADDADGRDEELGGHGRAEAGR